MARAEIPMIAILSPDYLGSRFGKAEWLAAWRTATEGGQRKLIPVKVANCRASGLLAGIVFVDLVGLSEADAERELGTKISAAISGRAKPTAKPKFPGATRTFKKKPQFPGPDGTNAPPPSPSTFPSPGNRASHTALPISARPQRLWLAAIAAILVVLAVSIVFHALSTHSPTTPGSGRTTGLATPSTEPAVASSGPPLSQNTVKTSNAAPTSSPLPSGDVTLRNVATENCADSTSSGDVFTYACNRASSQQWSALPVSGSVYALKDILTGLCLTGTTQGLSSAPCDAADDQQQWRWSEQGSRGSLTHLANGHCLADLGAENLTTAVCDGTADQDWQIVS
jgi:hypothetical protein